MKRDNNNTKKRLHVEQDSDEEPPRRKKFTSISKIVMKEKLVEDLFIEVHRQWIELNRPKSSASGSGGKKYKSETKSSVTPNKGLDSIVVMESNLLLPAIPKASVKPVRKSLRGSFSCRNDPKIQKGIYADIHIPGNRYLMEVTGEALRKSEYKADTRNKFSLLGTPLPSVFFYPSLDICLDARLTGNDTRFIRRSCCPNSEIKSIILPNDNEDHTIHMGIYTKDDVDKGEEITIGWNWYKGNIMWKKNKEFKEIDSKGNPDVMDEDEKRKLKDTLDQINYEFGKCACEDEEDCLFEYLKEELEREESPAPTKKQSNSKKSTTRVNDIFTTDEEDIDDENEEIKPKVMNNNSSNSSSSNSNKKKKVQFNQKPTKPIIPSPPTVHLDIVPATSSNEIETGSKRTRPIPSGIKLPCKKKWLHDYISQQQQQQQKDAALKTEAPVPVGSPEKISKELERIYDEGELSDGDSSQSTLPLDDTLVIQQQQKEQQPVDDNLQLSNDSIKQQPENVTHVETNTSSSEIEITKPIAVTEQVSNQTVEQPKSKEETTEEPPAPKVKLSIQEYLKRQRGNLPTPDGKH